VKNLIKQFIAKITGKTFKILKGVELNNLKEFEAATFSFSQYGEDFLVRREFPFLYRGFYVDVGCYDPVVFSNTLFFKNGDGGV
jgi:hypothetical protein